MRHCEEATADVAISSTGYLQGEGLPRYARNDRTPSGHSDKDSKKIK